MNKAPDSNQSQVRAASVTVFRTPNPAAALRLSVLLEEQGIANMRLQRHRGYFYPWGALYPEVHEVLVSSARVARRGQEIDAAIAQVEQETGEKSLYYP